MCCCGKPTINGQPGQYSWDGKSFNTYPHVPPETEDGDTVIYDEPGRCGGVDNHCHAYMVVKSSMARWFLLYRHGGGQGRIEIPRYGFQGDRYGDPFKGMDSDHRYWLMHSMFSVWKASRDQANTEANARWRKAALEKKIKIRRKRGNRFAEIVA